MHRVGTKPKNLKSSLKEKENRKREFIGPIREIQDLLGDGHYIPVKTIESFYGTYIQYDSNGDTYFETLSAEENENENFKKMKIHFIDINEEFNNARSSFIALMKTQ